ncbi:MAG: hypothetical protein WCV90_02245 [Candidatus Woesearchaeota archaeon]
MSRIIDWYKNASGIKKAVTTGLLAVTLAVGTAVGSREFSRHFTDCEDGTWYTDYNDFFHLMSECQRSKDASGVLQDGRTIVYTASDKLHSDCSYLSQKGLENYFTSDNLCRVDVYGASHELSVYDCFCDGKLDQDGEIVYVKGKQLSLDEIKAIGPDRFEQILGYVRQNVYLPSRTPEALAKAKAEKDARRERSKLYQRELDERELEEKQRRLDAIQQGLEGILK